MFFKPSWPMWRYVLRMWVFSFIPTIIIGFLLSLLIPSLFATNFRAIPDHDFTAALLAVTIGPLVETLILALLLGLASYVIKDVHGLAIASAIVWAMLHSLAWAPWGLLVVWSFYVMSRAFMAWFEYGLFEALLVTTFIHMAHNFLPALFSLLG
ncbi:hypothetical protein HY230_08995 [Candidatus Acetothermia bacterium]|nr:hypothetical protein [Candidatus Acetothermia bacterium]MBI3660590.1 hypothetical protein [Candidatus Acetothermia bacterium]